MGTRPLCYSQFSHAAIRLKDILLVLQLGHIPSQVNVDT
jgi:hypothetical protein